MPRPDGDDVAPGHVAIGRVLAPSGVHGELKVQPMAPQAQFTPGRTVLAAGRSRAIERSRRRGSFCYVKLTGVDTRADGEALRNAYLQVPEAALEPLPAGQFYRFQLIGLTVRSTDGRDLGEITGVLSTPENDVFVVDGALGEVLVPATDDVVLEVDLERRVVTVEVIPGLLG